MKLLYKTCVYFFGLSVLLYSNLLGAAELNSTSNQTIELGLAKQYSQEKNSFIISPISIELAMSMVSEGAGGNTSEQFKKNANLPLSNLEKVLSVFKLEKIPDQESKNNLETVLKSVQKVWVEKNFPLEQKYTDILKQKYESEIEVADFKKNPSVEEEKINSWVAQNTQNKILQLIPKNQLTVLTRLVLVNAIYFKSFWMFPFDKKNTKDGKFYLSASDAGKAESLGVNKKTKSNKSNKLKFLNLPLMQNKFVDLDFFEDDDVKSIWLPYVSHDLTLQLLLPKSEKFKIENYLHTQPDKYKSKEIIVTMPRFKSEFSVELSNNFRNMGLVDAFSDKANFSKISTSALSEKLYISKVIHKAFIEVNEEGTEAAAATAVVMSGRGLPAKPKEFKANRPFYYIIKTADQILFMGYFSGQ